MVFIAGQSLCAKVCVCKINARLVMTITLDGSTFNLNMLKCESMTPQPTISLVVMSGLHS